MWAWLRASGWPWPSELVREHGYVVIPPYDDEQIIAGQATCGLEIVEALPDVDLVLAPVSGGGLLSGVAAAVKQLRPTGQGLRRRAGAGRRHGGELPHRQDRHLAGRADQPHHCRRPAHAERGRSATLPTSRPLWTASLPSPRRRFAPPCGPSWPLRVWFPNPAERWPRGAALPCGRSCRLIQESRGRGQRRQRRAGAAGRSAHEELARQRRSSGSLPVESRPGHPANVCRTAELGL